MKIDQSDTEPLAERRLGDNDWQCEKPSPVGVFLFLGVFFTFLLGRSRVLAPRLRSLVRSLHRKENGEQDKYDNRGDSDR